MDRIAKPVIAVVDDDWRVRESLASLIESAGFTARVFPLATDLLNGDFLAGASCLITDVRMPEMDGLDLQRMRPARAPAPACHLDHRSSR
jgi:FixJ family two-component response regulator